MISKEEAKEIIRDLFEEEGLVIGGIVAVHEVEDDVVWQLMKNLDVVRRKVLSRLDNSDGEDEPETRKPNLHPHPAIEEFLRRVRGE